MSIKAYRSSLRSIVRGYWSGAIDAGQFDDEMRNAINRRLAEAFEEGSKKCGISPDEYTEKEWQALGEIIQKELTFVPGLQRDIAEDSRENEGKLGQFFARVDLWVNRYTEVKDQAIAMTCGDKKLEWVMNPVKENCTSCLKLNGQVRRASFWEERGLRPKSDQLECMQSSGGVPVCGCEFVVTDKPASRGPLPRI